VNPSLFEPNAAAEGVAPVGVAAVYKHVARLECAGYFIQALIHLPSSTDVQEHDSRRCQPLAKLTDRPNHLQAQVNEIRGGVTTDEPHDANQGAAHSSQAHYSVLQLSLKCHRRSY
jgi:hypothetical protein